MRLGFDVRRITWKRVMDMNDRALRDLTDRPSAARPMAYPREDGFDIVVASEVMAIFCLATSLADLKQRLGRIIVVGHDRRAATHHAPADLKAHGAMAALLKDALAPNRGANAREQLGLHSRRPVSPTSLTAATPCWPRATALEAGRLRGD